MDLYSSFLRKIFNNYAQYEKLGPMAQMFFPKRYFSVGDVLVFFVLGASVYGLIATGVHWRAEFQPVTEIDLSLRALPLYALFSTIRGLTAYALSLIFTLVVGYMAAKSKKAEMILIPLIDILQSVPILGFLPGLVLALVALFPKTNTGLELVAIILVFTGQVWNMTFSFYSSLKALPTEYHEAAKIIGLNWWRKLLRIELPYSAVNLAWNSLMSMAGGWFFLTVAESFILGSKEYRIPGVGSYMAVAISKGDVAAMLYGIATMISIIVLLDFIIWRPALSFVRKFRLEETGEGSVTEPLMLLALKESRLMRLLQYLYKKNKQKRLSKLNAKRVIEMPQPAIQVEKMRMTIQKKLAHTVSKWGMPVVFAAGITLVFGACFKLIHTLSQLDWGTWVSIFGSTSATFLRVIGSLIFSSLWAVPLGLWIGLSPKRTRIAQPIVQILASFPTPMLYPLVLKIFFSVGIGLNLSSMFLMMLGVQWYILFNVIAGALRISQELNYTTRLMQTSNYDRWRVLYLPSIFPALVTGWITAAGGAWNASIVAEYLSYQGQTLTAYGLGSLISHATNIGDMTLLAASLTVMIGFVVLINRTFWAKIYNLAQSRYRLD